MGNPDTLAVCANQDAIFKTSVNSVFSVA
jgi:hypothetical protein